MQTKTKTKIVYKMEYAIKMRDKGHIILMTMPNPCNARFNCWVFEYDDTFDSDFEVVKAEGRKYHGNS